MAITDDQLRQQLQEAFLEIAFRANRLQEWVNLSRELDKLKHSFEDFNTEANHFISALTNGNQNANAMTNRWSIVSDTDLRELKNVRIIFDYINRAARVESAVAAPGAAGANMGLLTIVSLELLFELQEKIQKDLNRKTYGTLQQRCADFDKALKDQASLYKRNMEKELRILCEMTLRVQMQI